ncbi:MAG: hypothetical protein Rpha_0946 [Candidatus Ruthia sp. Apha_13_S6]|nr:hypothetical protein [Candidatus Ruthia sp. Apha_13_S6]
MQKMALKNIFLCLLLLLATSTTLAAKKQLIEEAKIAKAIEAIGYFSKISKSSKRQK